MPGCPTPSPVTVPPDGDTRQSYLAARDVCRHHAKSFYFSSFFLPKPKRFAAYAVYAFCRLLDDTVDDAEAVNDRAAAEAGIEQFQELIEAAYDPTRQTPAAVPLEIEKILPAFRQTITRYEIPKQHFKDLAEGCRMDLTISRYATWHDLENYCYHVAGVVGLIMCCVFELKNVEATKQAVSMGNAMQLTNILRDVREDFERGRVYLPAEDLARFQILETELASRTVDDRFTSLMRFEIDRARSLYLRAAEGLMHLPDDGSRFTACAMASIYSGILGAIERQKYDVFATRAHLGTMQKIARLPRARRLSKTGDATTAFL